MAIDLTNMSSTPTTSTRGRIDGTTVSGQSGKGDKGVDSTASQPATVKLSSEGQSLQKLEEQVAQLPDVDLDRVAGIKKSIEEGSFNIDPERIAAKMIDLEDQLFG